MGGSRSRRDRRPPARRAPRRPPPRPLHRRIPRHSHRFARPARPAHRFARRLARRHPSSIASRSRRARPFIPHAPQRIEPLHGAELRARRGGFLRRARARDDARSRDVGERLRDHRLVAVCRRRRARASSRVVARLFRTTARSRDASSPSRRRDRRRRAAPRHRSVRHLRRGLRRAPRVYRSRDFSRVATTCVSQSYWIAKPV